MKKIALVSALALALSGCATVNGQVDPRVQQAQDIAVAVCGFLPTAETVTGIISTFVPGALPAQQIASQVADAICKAVTAKSAKRGGAKPQVNGVTVSGKFV